MNAQKVGWQFVVVLFNFWLQGSRAVVSVVLEMSLNPSGTSVPFTLLNLINVTILVVMFNLTDYENEDGLPNYLA